MRRDSASARAQGVAHRVARGIDLTGTILLLLAVDFALRWGRLPRIAAVLGCPLSLTSADAPDCRTERLGPSPTATQIRHLRDLDRALRRLPGLDTCLRRSLVSGFYLRRMRPVLRIGVAKSVDAVTAHAWIEIDGAAVHPGDPGSYRVLRGLIPPPAQGAA